MKLPILTIFILSISIISSAETDFFAQLQQFDQTLVELSYSKDPQERAAAVTSLARIGSPKYEEVRNRLLEDQELIIKKALLEALPYVLNITPEAKQILLNALTSENDELISLASGILGPHLDVPYEFRDLWKTDRPLRLWREYELKFHYNFDVTNLTGVGHIRPWKDPAWREIPSLLKQDLLLRAGTHEAIEILKKEFSIEKDSWVTAELVNPAALHELLSDTNPKIRKYAASSLLQGGDPLYIERLKSRIDGLLKETGKQQEILTIDGISLYEMLPHLSTSTLKIILKTDFGLNASENFQHFATVIRELNSRGEPLSLSELTVDNVSYLPEKELHSFQISALILNKTYTILPTLLKKLVKTRTALGIMSHQFARSPGFLSSLPDDVAHESYLILKSELIKRSDNTESLLRLVGMISRGRDADELWEEWQKHPDPLTEDSVFVPVLWGFNKRSAEVRKILGAPYAGGSAFDDLEEFYFKFQNPPCRLPSNVISELPVELPVYPDSIWQADLKLTESILQNFDGIDSDQFREQFLRFRGIVVSASKPESFIPHLDDSRSIVRQILWNWIKDKLPYSLNITWPHNYRSVKEALAIKNIDSTSFTLPKPTLSKSDANWVRNLIALAKKKYINKQVEQFYSPYGPTVVVMRGLGPEPTQIYASQPSDFFLNENYGEAFMPEIERLTESQDPDLQYAALWALWKLNRDQKILDVWLRDAQNTALTNTDLQLKARALYVLQKIRYKPAASLFPPLLKNADKRLRQTALLGVQAFKLREFLPEVKQMINDEDLTVGETALATLGSFPEVENRTILLSFLDGSERQSFIAMNTLTNFKGKEDIDAFAELMKNTKQISARHLLYKVAKRVTYQSDTYLEPLVNDGKSITEEEIEEWLTWWAYVRNEPKETRIRNALQRSAQQLSDPREQLWWKLHLNDDLLTIFQRSLHNEKTIFILLETHPEWTKRFLFSEFLRKVRAGSFEPPISHKILVEMSGEDFGDPYIANCETKAQIVSDWLNWARQNNILQ